MHQQTLLPGDVLGAGDSPVDGRRKHRRVSGPFDGIRVGALETPVQLYDLSRGGCYINSAYQQRPGMKLRLKLDLPEEGWITIHAESLDRRNEYGFAVRFVDVNEEAAARLDRALLALDRRESQDV